MTKKLVRLEASEVIYYEFYIEVDVPEDEEWCMCDLQNEAECILYESDLSYSEHIIDDDAFTINEACDYGKSEDCHPWIKNRIIRPLDKA